MKLRQISKLLIIAFLGAFLLHSCSDDDPVIGPDIPQGEFDNGVFVLNEGHFPDPGSVTFISQNLDSVQQKIYRKVNGGEDAGSVLQSMFFDDSGHAYIISNNSNFITVVDRYTFEKVGRITKDLNHPRYGVIVNGKAYVTNQASFATGQDDYVAVIDLSSFKTTQKVLIGNYVEFILAADNGQLYIQGAAFNKGDQVYVLDPATNTIVDSMQTAKKLNSIAIQSDFLYALSNDTLQKFDLHRHVLMTSINLPYTKDAANLDLNKGMLYFTVGKKVFKIAANSTTAPTNALFSYTTNSARGVFYGFAVKGNRIYVADGGDFASNSFIEVYDLDGQKLEKIDVGIGPTDFYFNL